MNVEINEILEKLIKEITESGAWELDPDKLKLIKSYCKRSDLNVQIVFDCVMPQLKKKHAQVRYSSLQLIEQLFDRSKYFRELITEDFPLFTQLTVGIQDKTLPPPAHVAKKLKEYAIALIKVWFTKFGANYRQLSVAFDFLMDNGYLEAESKQLSAIHASDRNKSGIDVRVRAVQASRYELLKSDTDVHIDIIKDNLQTMESCFEILIPKHDFINEDIDFDSLLRGEVSSKRVPTESYKEDIMSHGLGSSKYKITIDLSNQALTEHVPETDENRILFDQLREAYTVLQTKHIKQLNDWINAMAKIEIADKKEKQEIVKSLISLKAEATEVSKKAQLLGIQVVHREKQAVANKNEEEEDDEYADEEFEDIQVNEVDKNTASSNSNIPISSKLPPMQRIFPLSFEPSMIEDATYNGPPNMLLPDEPKKDEKGKGKIDTNREELLKSAPTVEWDEDLYYWDKKHVQFNTSGIEKSHRFMGIGDGTSEMPEHLLDQLRKRTIYYKPEELPTEIKACRYLLRNGSLCPRKDLKVCPFHGLILPRDEQGQLVNSEDIAAEAARKAKEGSQYGHDNPAPSSKVTPEIMSNLWELVGGDVLDRNNPSAGASGHHKQRGSSSNRGGKVKKEQKSGLIDIRKKPDTSFTRINKKISSSKTRKLVEEALEHEREMKSRNKQANNWK